ncbi:MAG: hydantoinase B/oxoprolinase family protein [Verrucomicrobiales bacterium]|nr:hydantoinase B/oxoprolinase family protein [Verrucomicrobiales bacterium]
MSIWQISADTGGTFTDCYGIPPDGDPGQARLVKVLSSARLRVAITGRIDDHRLRIDLPDGWNAPDGFFACFQADIGGETCFVSDWKAGVREIALAAPLPAQLPSAFDLFTGEVAPVLGARLLTGTGLHQDFPPLEFRLGTTRGTNALLERKGAPTALFITRGFGDLLTIRDQRRPDLFALAHPRPAPLHQAVIEVDERLDASGAVLQPLDPGFEAGARDALARGIRLAAVALLHSYRNPVHERLVRDRLLALGFEHVSLSSDLAPLIKLLPRAETAVVDATLTPVLGEFLASIRQPSLLVMTSAGGLEPAARFRPKDSLLSGPAGGVVGAATAARALGYERIITFDMGGTSTDVARVDGDYLYRFEQRVGDARLLAPALRIETVASGGGSICRWTSSGLRVGPESAGADPGPACYGRGGPLTITDVNLLLGRIDPDHFGIPIGPENLAAARSALAELRAGVPDATDESLLLGLAAIATEQMADAIRTISIREGADPADHALVAFGGAGPLHACDIAERLGIRTILVPREAGLLSAYGIHHAAVERFAERQVLAPLDACWLSLADDLDQLAAEALSRLKADLDDDGSGDFVIRRRLAEIRLIGQDATLTVEIADSDALADAFRRAYETIFGYPPDPARPLELVTLRVVAATRTAPAFRSDRVSSPIEPCLIGDHTRFHRRADLAAGATLIGPAVVQDPFSTLYLKAGWTAAVAGNSALILTAPDQPAEADVTSGSEAIARELFRHRFENVVEEMGAMLQRSAISTNVKERADYSCALLDASGSLVVNAPHIPVHLGALGLCVREVARALKMGPGDTIVTNHPGYGGSHLPDVTLITPVFTADGATLIGYVANRAHHAEIGGIRPGSMPPDATCLAEEGVVIPPMHLVRGGAPCFEAIERRLTVDAPHPTRRLADNLADLHAQLAANRRGADLLAALAASHGADEVRRQLENLGHQARDTLREHLDASGFESGSTVEPLDDGTAIHLSLRRERSAGHSRLVIDFTGTTARHPGNLNATPAIVRSAILYVLRLWVQCPMPLNEGLLRDVDIVLPSCFLDPAFPDDPTACPAVVGGNVETSQRLVDGLVRVLGIQADSQGTMNNFLFGNDRFGYYETIGGGSGAGPDHDGTGGLHTHMTNTAITDPEILEQRYPVRLRRFSLRPGSGGDGRHRGGDGLIREIEFLEPLRVSLLTQRRTCGPRGLAGGQSGAPGRQTLTRAGADTPESLPGIAAFDAAPGDVLRIETPGGGGWGDPGEKAALPT